ncbi:tetratricopeptide repeat protein [Gammaproteobacteria bacterium AB-CW1]|uniref:Tetratricopeptide repeat protein n=1 Tax=Natronospira elongata TaxID=3110268 RepID=A0AAP6JEC6_9GAMM|nr:tetratricopeptide repeat protein [Gammaproteobacteria bacterium AB-CW1]
MSEQPLAEITKAVEAGRLQEAVAALAEYLQAEPGDPNAWFLQSRASLAQGKPEAAWQAARQALAIAPDSPNLRYAVGNLGLRLARYPEALDILDKLPRPLSPDQQYRLAQACWGAGQYKQSLEHFEYAADNAPQVHEISIALARAYVALGRDEHAIWVLERLPLGDQAELLAAIYRFDHDDLAGSAERIRGAGKEGDPLRQTALAGIALLQGDDAGAEALIRDLPDGGGWPARVESMRYARDHGPDARWFTTPVPMLETGLAAQAEDGLILEFGVQYGRSLNQIAVRSQGTVHGFDSFQGLPDSEGVFRAGSQAAPGGPTHLANNARLYTGLFQQTLPAFLAETDGLLSFVHMDCALASSTEQVLELLKPRMQSGTVLLFGDYLAYPGWQDGQYRAWQRFADAAGIRYEYLGFSPITETRALLRITGISA